MVKSKFQKIFRDSASELQDAGRVHLAGKSLEGTNASVVFMELKFGGAGGSLLFRFASERMKDLSGAVQHTLRESRNAAIR